MTLCGSVLIGGFYFAFNLIMLLVEQYESLEDNQSYIDELKDEFGMQQPLWVTLKQNLGEDYIYWFLPTYPAIDTNYLERVWSRKETIKMYRTNEFDTEERKSDPERSAYSRNWFRSWFEKITVILFLGMVWQTWSEVV
jgi:hypothetical protein